VSVAIDQPGETEIGDAAEPASACTALVPMAQALHAPPSAQRLDRPDAFFVTQLIATAEHAPQTCALRRATPEAAQAAYGSVTNRTLVKFPGGEVQQII
jgi:hypothetical protein